MARDQTGGLPRAILHIDGDGFFAGCEVALNPRLRGKPVIVGQERGIALSYSPEAKALGITRAMPITQVKRLFPQVIVVPSDYETYSIFSKRMFAIVRRYTGAVEEYSIDECFAEITGLEQTLRGTYTQIAERIKNDLKTELGMTFSVGLSSTKVLSKLASRWNKPDGLTVITNQLREHYLTCAPVKNLWGIGPQTTKLLKRHNVLTANDFAQRDEEWVHEVLTKAGTDIWRELHGEVVFELTTENKDDYRSIQKVRTFSPPSTDREYIFAQLSKNIENACIKLRRHKLHARTGYFFLKTQDMRYRGTR